MWTARPEGWFSRRYLVEERGQLVGEIEYRTWSERGAIACGERYLTVEREGFWRGTHRLIDHGEVVALARGVGAFRRGFALAHGGQEYRLEPSSIFGSAFDLAQGSRSLGGIRTRGFWCRNAEITLDDELAPELRLFVFWLVALAWRRAAAAAAS